MAKFAIAFFEENSGLKLKVVESDTKEAALRYFFDHHSEGYSPNSEGYSYFKDDFLDSNKPFGAISEV
jgi:hypothetical protein